jgi:hypothetical protein
MSGPGQVTVCIPTYNQCEYLAGAVKSALNQTLPPAAIIVSNDASTDGTEQLMKALLTSHPEVRYIRQDKNLGIAENNTRLMELVETDFAVRLDSDDELMPTYIETILPKMQIHERSGYGHCAIQRIDDSGQKMNEVFLNRPPGYQAPDEALRAAVKGYRVAANIVMYRTAAIRQVNLFCGRPDYVEDYDMSARLAEAGWGNVYTDKILARYRVWSDLSGVRKKRKALELAGYIRIFDEVFAPAFAGRGWATHPLTRQRRRLALIHANACFLSQFSTSETEHLTRLLRQLGGSPLLTLKLLLMRNGFAPIFERFLHLRGDLKGLAKKKLTRWRAIGKRWCPECTADSHRSP